jgi:hypothetical protein
MWSETFSPIQTPSVITNTCDSISQGALSSENDVDHTGSYDTLVSIFVMETQCVCCGIATGLFKYYFNKF